MANTTLKHALQDAGLTSEQFADILSVDPKTVQRWVAGRVPRPRHRAAIARALDLSPHELWPNDVPAPPAAEDEEPQAAAGHTVIEVAATWASPRTSGAPTITSFLAGTRRQIDVLESNSGLRHSPGLVDQLRDHARRGCHIRVIVDQLTPPELMPLVGHPGVELRAAQLQLVHAVIRADDDLLLGLRLVGEQHQPLLQLRRQLDDGLFDAILAHFDHTWELAQPIDTLGANETARSEKTEDLPSPRRWPGRPN